MHRMDKLLGAVIACYSVVGAVAIFLMMAHITADVAGKFLFNRPLPGTTPIVAQYYMVVAVFLPLALVERMSGHISVEVLYTHMPRSLRGILTVLATALGIVVFAALTWATWGEAMKKYAIGSFNYEQGVRVPVWPSYFILPAGTALLVAMLIWRLVAQLSRIEDPAAIHRGPGPDRAKDAAID